MPTNIAAILIVAPAGRVRDSLRVLLKSTRPLIHIDWAEEFSAALPQISVSQPTLVLLDAALPDGQTWQALEHIRLHYPQHRCMILAHFAEHQRQAQELDVPVVLLDSFTARSLFTALDQIT